MKLTPLLFMVFLQSAAAGAAEHAIFFYTQEVHGFSVMQNLLLALIFGISYVAGAIKSHNIIESIARRTAGLSGERTLLLFLILGHIAVYTVLTLYASPWAMWLLWPVLGWMGGTHWPIVESYIVAGRLPRAASLAIGRFNITWSIAVVLSVAIAGVLIHWWQPALLALCAALNLASLILVLLRFPRRALHLELDHPERLPAATIESYLPLSRSAKWSMLSCYTLMFVLGPYLPAVFDRLGFGLTAATLLASILYAARVLGFFAMERWHGWHGLRWPLAVGALAMPAGALLVLLGSDTATVILGMIGFGLFGGVVYTASLYYGMAMKNASVQAGGDHEAVIGTGFTAGPLLGMLGTKLATPLGPILGMTAGLSPIILVGLIGGLWPLRSRCKHEGKTTS